MCLEWDGDRIFVPSRTWGLLQALVASILFVVSLYWFDGGSSNRNDDRVILQRFKAVGLCSAVCILGSVSEKLLLGIEWTHILQLFGIRTDDCPWRILAETAPCVLILLGYMGHILLVGPRHAFAVYEPHLQWIRNLIVGPLAEEIVFRAFILSSLIFHGYSFWESVLLSSSMFSVAHAHHAYTHIREKKAPITQVVVSVAFQLLYTFVFGVFSAYWFLITGSLLSVIFSHSLCNLLGIPQLPSSCSKRYTMSWILIVVSIMVLISAWSVFSRTLWRHNPYSKFTGL